MMLDAPKVETGIRNKQISETQTIYSDKITLKDKFSVNGERIRYNPVQGTELQ